MAKVLQSILTGSWKIRGILIDKLLGKNISAEEIEIAKEQRLESA